MTEYQRDERTDEWGEWVDVWLVEPPDVGVAFRVTEQEWNADYTERRITGFQVHAL